MASMARHPNVNGHVVRDALTPDDALAPTRPRYPPVSWYLPLRLYMLADGRRSLLAGPSACGGLLIAHLSIARGRGADVIAGARRFYVLDSEGGIAYVLALE